MRLQTRSVASPARIIARCRGSDMDLSPRVAGRPRKPPRRSAVPPLANARKKKPNKNTEQNSVCSSSDLGNAKLPIELAACNLDFDGDSPASEGFETCVVVAWRVDKAENGSAKKNWPEKPVPEGINQEVLGIILELELLDIISLLLVSGTTADRRGPRRRTRKPAPTPSAARPAGSA